jgi:hypothetical protein
MMKAKTDESKPVGAKPGASAESKAEAPSAKPGSESAAVPDPQDDLKPALIHPSNLSKLT